jgi:hypothetical protein
MFPLVMLFNEHRSIIFFLKHTSFLFFFWPMDLLGSIYASDSDQESEATTVQSTKRARVDATPDVNIDVSALLVHSGITHLIHSR